MKMRNNIKKIVIFFICSVLLITACAPAEMVQVSRVTQMPSGGETLPEVGNTRGTSVPEGGVMNLSGPYVINWHQEGGIAGVCLDVVITSDGAASAVSCKGGDVVELGRAQLTEEQMNTLNGWTKQYKNFQFENKDKAVADAMTIRLSFVGNGDQEVSETVSIAMQRMASDLLKIIRKQ